MVDIKYKRCYNYCQYRNGMLFYNGRMTTMKLRHYSFVRMKVGEQGALGLTTMYDTKNVVKDSNYYVSALGEIYGREGFEDGTTIYTGPVAESTKEYVRTRSSSKYVLVQKDPDYVEFENAIMRRIPILDNWSIVVNRELGVCIKGIIRENSEPFLKKVISQVGPFLTLADGSYIFVDWISISKKQLKNMAFAVDMGLVRKRPFCLVGFEPFVMMEDWAIVNGLSEISFK